VIVAELKMPIMALTCWLGRFSISLKTTIGLTRALPGLLAMAASDLMEGSVCI
jgi:hypothetical protein